MKPNVILLLSTDPFVERAVTDAVKGTQNQVRVLQSSRDAFALFESGCSDVDLAIIDLDPGMHGVALLEAASERLPIIALTGLEEEYMRPIAARHGAVACLSKPLTLEQLRAEIEQALHAPT